jgi:hypothetical protein
MPQASKERILIYSASAQLPNRSQCRMVRLVLSSAARFEPAFTTPAIRSLSFRMMWHPLRPRRSCWARRRERSLDTVGARRSAFALLDDLATGRVLPRAAARWPDLWNLRAQRAYPAGSSMRHSPSPPSTGLSRGAEEDGSEDLASRLCGPGRRGLSHEHRRNDACSPHEHRRRGRRRRRAPGGRAVLHALHPRDGLQLEDGHLRPAAVQGTVLGGRAM